MLAGSSMHRQSPTIAELLGKTKTTQKVKQNLYNAQNLSTSNPLDLSPDQKLKSMLAGITNTLGQQTNNTAEMNAAIRDAMS